MTRLKKPITGLASVLVTAAIIAVGIQLLSPAEPPDPTVVAARGAAEGALTALYYDVFPPPDYRGGPLASPAAAVIRARVVADIERYFSPSLQARYEPMILGAVDTIGSGEWEAAGGFSSLDWKGISVTDDHATLGLRASGWVLRRGGADGVAPDATTRLDSTWDWSFTLVRIDGLWRVDTLDATCVRGCP